MPTVKGKADVARFIATAPEQIVERVLRGAGRAAATIVATEAKDRVISDDVAQKIKVRTRIEDGKVIARVQVLMGRNNLPLWIEYGTDGHFISVANSDRAGLSVRKVNERSKAGTLVINGQFAGETVWHPGARAHPFLRPSLDIKEAEAIRAAQTYISTRVTRAGIVGKDEGDEA